MNVLITSASRKVSLVKVFREALAAEGGGRVVAADADWRSAALYFADARYLVPRGLGPEFTAAIDRICESEQIALVIPTRDEELPVFARRRGEMAARGVTVMVASPESVEICQDKKRFIEFCRANSFAVPETCDISAGLASVRYPVFVKGRYGKSSINTGRASTETQLRELLARIEDPIVQECVEAQEYTIDVFADFQAVPLRAVVRERVRVMGGESFVGRTSKRQDVIAECARLSRRLGLVGHNTVQCFVHEGAVKFVEVNPRFGGGASLGFAAGACTPRYLIQLLKGEPVTPCLDAFEDGLTMLRYTEDIFISAADAEREQHPGRPV